MKPTQITELLANIKKTFVSFFSIIMFVALGVGVFLGIYWSGPSLETAADKQFDELAFHNYELAYQYGFTDDDLNEILAIEGIDEVEGAYASYEVWEREGSTHATRIQTIGSTIDRLEVVEGALPVKENEVVVLQSAADNLGIKLGDALAFQSDKADEGESASPFSGKTLDVVGIVKSPAYLGLSSRTYGIGPTITGQLDLIAWVAPNAFSNAEEGVYPLVNIRSNALAGLSTFDSEYKTLSNDIEERLSAKTAELASKRYEKVHGDAEKQIDDAQKQLDEAKEQVDEGESKIEEAKDELEWAIGQVNSGYAQLSNAKDKIAAGEQELAEGKKKLEEMQSKYDEGVAEAERLKSIGEKQLADAQKDVDATKKKLDDLKAKLKALEDAAAKKQAAADRGEGEPPTKEELAAIDAARAEIEAAEAELASKQSELDESQEKYDEALKAYKELRSEFESKVAEAKNEIEEHSDELAAAKSLAEQKASELASAQAQITSGEQEVQAKETELEDAKKQIDDNEGKLDESKKLFDSMGELDCAIGDRSDNGGVAYVSTFSDITNRLSFSMAALFVIVGLLVSYSAISRIVREQIIQVGTKKALGIRSKEITASFLAYAGAAVAIGIVIGAIASVFIVQGIIGHALGKQFVFGTPEPYFDIKLVLFATAIELVLILGTAWLACRSILKQNAVELLRGEKPPEAKTRFYEKWGIWDRLPLYTQTILNNCLNEKRRMFSTIVGVAGCTALIVTALTLNDDVLKSYDIHYDEVYSFNAIAYVDSEVDGAIDTITEALGEQGCDGAPIQAKMLSLVQPNGNQSILTTYTPEDIESFTRFYHVIPRDGATFDLSGDGVWMSEGYRERVNAKVGDIISVKTAKGDPYDLPILGFYEYHLTYAEAIIGRDAYTRIFNEEFTPNRILVDTGGKTVKEVENALSGTDGFVQLSDDKLVRKDDFDSFADVSFAVVLIYLAMSILMAIVVLLNLNVMQIMEKKRELIVLMINGYSVRDAKRYIYNDTIILTAIGIICGLVLGTIMGMLSVKSVEPANVLFYKGIDWKAIVVAIVVSSVLSFIMSAIALRRIPKFQMSDINRM